MSYSAYLHIPHGESTSHIKKNTTQLFISFQKPYSAVSCATISRWIKHVITEAGIDTSYFKAHSTRAAAATSAKLNDVPVDDILQVAEWSNARTFQSFSDKVVFAS